MIRFFEESLQAVDHVGSPVLANGDVIVVDNCGFHYRVFVENQMHLMLRNSGVELIFQPPYSNEFNSYEFCFRLTNSFQLTSQNLPLFKVCEQSCQLLCKTFSVIVGSKLKFESQLAWSKLPIKIPTLCDNINCKVARKWGLLIDS